jgi:hypothetical protein
MLELLDVLLAVGREGRTANEADFIERPVMVPLVFIQQFLSLLPPIRAFSSWSGRIFELWTRVPSGRVGVSWV